MSEPVLVEFKVDTSSVEGYLPEKGDAVIAALMAKSNQIGAMLQMKVLGKLEGDPIKSHTHKLARSVLANEATNDGETITQITQAGGGPAFYGKYHEYGGTFDVATRRIQIGFSSKADRIQLALEAKRGGYDFITHVQSKPYTITFPERSFMRSTLDENKASILEQMQNTVRRACRESNCKKTTSPQTLSP